MNLFIFSGNLTKDCRVGRTANDKAACNFTVANTTGKGSDYEHTEFIECAIFGKRAESKLTDYLVKGQKVTITGEAKLSQREHNGKHYANISVMVGELELNGGKPKSSEAPQKQATSNSNDFDEDKIPF